MNVTLFFTKYRVLICILFISFLLRLYHFSYPIADWHSWRQADTSAVSRNFVKHGYDLLHPRFDDLSNVPSGMDNPQGYRFVEFPIYNALQAGLFQTFGIFTLEEWGRLVTIFSSLSTAVFIFLLVKKYASERAGIFAAAFYGFLPYSVFYGRVVLPDPSTAASSLGAVYFFSQWIEQKKPTLNRYFFTSLLLSVIALLLKPYALFFLLPIYYLILKKCGIKAIANWKIWLFTVLSFVPLILWRLWMSQYPEGIPSNLWLLNGNGIRFRPAFFRWMVYERLIKLLFGFAGSILVFLGTLRVLQKRQWFFISYIAGMLLYIIIFATGNVQHDYYQILIFPTLCMIAGIGSEWFIQLCRSKLKNETVGFVIVGIIFSLSFYFSWQIVKGYYFINKPSIVTGGKAVDRLTPKDAKIVAIYGGDTSFLYQTNRQGWPTLQNGLEDLKKKGADFMVFADPTDEEINFGKDYAVVEQTKEYIIFDLSKKR